MNTKRKPGRPVSADPRKTISLRLRKSTLAGLDTLAGGGMSQTQIIEMALIQYMARANVKIQGAK